MDMRRPSTYSDHYMPSWLSKGYGCDLKPRKISFNDHLFDINETRNITNKEEGQALVPTALHKRILNINLNETYEAPQQRHTPKDCLDGPTCHRVVINVSGQRFETQVRTLERFPQSLLGRGESRRTYWDDRRKEYFFDRHRPSFQAILYFYQSGGRLRRPPEVPEDVFLEEIKFFQLGEEAMAQYRKREGFPLPFKRRVLPLHPFQRRVWLFCDDPNSSFAAKFFAALSIVCIIVSITNFCLETIPKVAIQCSLHGSDLTLDTHWIVETICSIWFTLEFALRLLSCPQKMVFAKNGMNIVDAIAIVPFFFNVFYHIYLGTYQSLLWQSCHDPQLPQHGDSLVLIRVLRVFRIFKLSKHSRGLRILALTIRTSLRELAMFFFFLLVAMVIFSSAAYYADMEEPETKLTSIPEAFWWALITMTTVGYGDIVPVGVWGKLMGTLCVIAGVLTVALPVPVVVANFNNFYRHEMARQLVSCKEQEQLELEEMDGL